LFFVWLASGLLRFREAQVAAIRASALVSSPIYDKIIITIIWAVDWCCSSASVFFLVIRLASGLMRIREA